MKKLSFSRSELLKAIRFCFILLAFAAAQAKVQADVTVNGTTVPLPFFGDSGANYNIATTESTYNFSNTSNGSLDLNGGSGIITIQPDSALVNGSGSAIYLHHGASYTVNNSGYLSGTGSTFDYFNNGTASWYGTALTVNNTGSIYGTFSGVYSYAGTLSVTNNSYIGGGEYGILSNQDGNVTINNSGSIYGSSNDAVSIDSYTSTGNLAIAITNSGSITSGNFYDFGDSGISVQASNESTLGNSTVTISNSVTGSISGYNKGIDLEVEAFTGNSVVTISNAGSISGYEDSAIGINANTTTGNATMTLTNSGSIYSEDDLGIDVEVETQKGLATITIQNLAGGSITSDDSDGIGAGAYVEGGAYQELSNGTYYGAAGPAASSGAALISVTNAGYIEADGSGISVYASGGASSNIYASDTPGATLASESTFSGSATVTVGNSGQIYAYSGDGIDAEAEIFAYATAQVTNSDNASLSATSTASGNATVTVSNSGYIYADDNGIDASARISANTNQDVSGSVDATASAIALASGNASVSVTNTLDGTVRSYGSAINAEAESDNGNASVVIGNAGSLESYNNSAIEAYAFSDNASATIEVTNSGYLYGDDGAGIYARAYGDTGSSLTINNSGYINAAYNGIYVDSNGPISVTNSGVINANTNGIYVDGSSAATINLAGGAIYSGGYAVQGNGNSIVSILGRTDLNSVLDGGSGSSLLNLKLTGLTPAEKALVDAAVLADPTTGSFTVGGRTYTWQNFSGTVNNAVSLQQVVDPSLQQLAILLDNNAAGLGAEYDPLFVAAAADPNAALASLGGQQYLEGRNDLALNLGTQLNAALMDRGYQLAAGMQGFTSTGLRLQDATMLASLGNIDNQLDSLMAQTMSDSTRAPYAIKRSPERRWGAWISGTATVLDQSDNSTTLGYEGTTASPTVGLDYQLTPSFSAGALAGYSNSDLDFSDNSKLKADTGLVGVYGAYSRDKWYATGLLSGAYTSYQNKRQILGNVADSSPEGTQLNAAISGGYNFTVKDWILAPELGVQYTRLMVDGYTETGAGAFNLNVGEQDTDSLRSQVGFRVNRTFDLSWIKLSPSLRASWFHEFLNDSRGVDASLAGLGSFQVKTNDPERDFALLGVGISGTFTESDAITLFLNYNTQVGQQDYVSHSVNAGFRVGF